MSARLQGDRPAGDLGRPRRRRHRTPPPGTSYTEAFTAALLEEAKADRRIVAMTAAMPGPTGLLPFEARYPDRFFDVGIAEQHAMTSAAGMALAGLRPIVAIYSTFLSGLRPAEPGRRPAPAPVVICAGPRRDHRRRRTEPPRRARHGLALAIPGMAVFAPSEPAEIAPMLHEAVAMQMPALVRYPKTPGRSVSVLSATAFRTACSVRAPRRSS